MIVKLGTKAKNIKEKDGLRVHLGLSSLDFKFENLLIVIGFMGMKGYATEFYKENMICIDASYKNHRRILINSFCYHNAIIPELSHPTFNKELKLQSNPNGYICIFLSNSGNFWKKYWKIHLDNLLQLLTNCSRKILIKLHPKENKSIKVYIESKGFSVVKDINTSDIYAAIVQGGSKCYDLAIKGIPIFCFDKYREPYMCNSIASDDINLLFQETINSFPNFSKYPEFIRMIQKHTVHVDEIENGNIFRKIKEIIK